MSLNLKFGKVLIKLLSAQKQPLESFNTKNRYKNLIFWLGLVQLATAFFWCSKNHPYTVIGIRVALFYIEAIICFALLLVKSERV